MNLELHALLGDKLAELSSSFELTPAAEQLIRLVIEAIPTDAGHRSMGLPEDCQRRAIHKLPKVLSYVQARRPHETIDVYDLLDAAPAISGMFFIFKNPD